VPNRATDAEREAAQRAPATVVVSQPVKSGREDDFRQWQDAMNRAVASFAGFLGTEVVAPGDEGREWTVIYRFDSKAHLEAWLASSDRAEILNRGTDLFDGAASQRVLIGEHEEDFVTVVVSHPVDPALVDEFLDWQQRVTDAERAFPGFGGSELFRPVPGVQEDWTAVFRFDTEEHLNDWLESPERKRLLDEGAHFQDFELHRIASPFGSWFSFGDADTEAPAQWKTALSVLVGLYPTVVLLTLGISEIWEDGELWETLLLGNILSVGLLTWVVMPIVTRALRFWLAPESRSAGGRLDATGAAVSIGFLTLAAIVFWLVTTQIWTLP
jgi:antibiotic biosynthesis monooxygenase (ABM) superfamily enzyme